VSDEVTVAFAYDRWDNPIDEAEHERAAQLDPKRSPVRVLERLAGR
jgi:hypothetical protein